MTKEEMLAAIPEFVEKHWPKVDPSGFVRTPGRGEAAVAIAAFITEVVPEDSHPYCIEHDQPEEWCSHPAKPASEVFDAFDWELLAEVEKYRGHIEDMPDDQRVFLIGMLAGALRRRLAHAGKEPIAGEEESHDKV